MAAASKSQYYSAVDPRTLGDCQLWLDAADRSTLTLSGSNVLTWKDKSRFGYDASAVGTPTFVSNKVNGYGGVFFSTTNGWMIGNASNTGTSLTAFVVADMSLNAMNDARILSLGTVGSQDFDSALRTSCIIRNASTAQIRSFRNNVTLGAVDISYDRPFIGTSVFTGTNNTLFRNGTNGTTVVSSGTFGYSNYGVGRDPGLVTTGRHVGHIYEVILYSQSLNNQAQTAIEGYLGWKWGIAAPLFNPTNIPNLVLWLDAADSTSIALSGSNVTQWNDKSGRGCNATQVTSARQPTYDSITKQLKFARASSQYLDLPDSTLPAGNSAYSYFIVASFTQLTSNLGLIGGGNHTISNGSFGVRSTGSRGVFVSWGTNNLNVSTSWLVNLRSIFETTYAPGGPRINYFNGGLVTTIVDTPGVRIQTTSNNTIGVTSIAAGQYMNGSIREIIVYSNQVDTQDRHNIESYLMTKWKIREVPSSSFANAHPYSLNRPLLRPFVPTDISFNCELWVDATDATTIDICQTTMTVRTVRPKGLFGLSRFIGSCNLSNGVGFSWNQNAFNQKYPAFYQGGNARTASHIGSNTFFSYAVQPITIHFVCDKINVDNGFGYIADSTFTSPRMAIYNHNLALFAGSGIGQTADTSLTIPSIGGAIANTTASRTYYNGRLRASGNIGTSRFGGLILGNRFSLDSGWDGHLCEFIIHNGVLPSNDRERIEGYLAWKWGLRDNLLSTHPYYLYPPMTVAFTPLSLSNCAVWLDGADPSVFDLSGDTSFVSTWRDKGLLNRSASSVSTNQSPTYVSNYVSFDSTKGELLSLSLVSVINQPFTIFAVEQRTSNKVNNYFIGNTASVTCNFAVGYSNDTTFHFIYGSGSVSSFTVTPSNESDPPRIWSFTHGGPSTNRETIEMGIFQTSLATPSNVSSNAGNSCFLGRYALQNYHGRMYEVIFYNRLLASNERMQVEGYLAHKWGRDASLNVIHPYRLVTP
jgi:hypothetical protein